MTTINPYINFNGNAEEAFVFYKSVFGGEFGPIVRFKDLESAESREDAERIFSGLSVDGSVEMPLSDSPWGTYFAMFRDKFGIEWTVEFDSSKA